MEQENYLISHKISIHAAQEGCDIPSLPFQIKQKRFQSTQPKRAATGVAYGRYFRIGEFQSTQPKRAATDFGLKSRALPTISIHAAQEGCDPLYSRFYYI